MWHWTIRYADEKGNRRKYETEDRDDLINFIKNLPESILKDSYVYDPDNRSVNAWVYLYENM